MKDDSNFFEDTELFHEIQMSTIGVDTLELEKECGFGYDILKQCGGQGGLRKVFS